MRERGGAHHSRAFGVSGACTQSVCWRLVPSVLACFSPSSPAEPVPRPRTPRGRRCRASASCLREHGEMGPSASWDRRMAACPTVPRAQGTHLTWSRTAAPWSPIAARRMGLCGRVCPPAALGERPSKVKFALRSLQSVERSFSPLCSSVAASDLLRAACPARGESKPEPRRLRGGMPSRGSCAGGQLRFVILDHCAAEWALRRTAV